MTPLDEGDALDLLRRARRAIRLLMATRGEGTFTSFNVKQGVTAWLEDYRLFFVRLVHEEQQRFLTQLELALLGNIRREPGIAISQILKERAHADPANIHDALEILEFVGLVVAKSEPPRRRFWPAPEGP